MMLLHQRKRAFERRDERIARRGVETVVLIRKRTMHHAETSDASFSRLADGRGFRAVVLPRGIAGDVAPFADGCRVKLADLGAGLVVDLRNFGIVVLRALPAEGFQLRAERQNDVLMIFRQAVENRLRHHQRLQHEPVGGFRARGQRFRDFLEPERNQAGGGGDAGVAGAGLHRGVDFVRRHRQHGRTRGLQHHVHFPRAAANLEPLGVFRGDNGPRTAGDAAGLPDPAQDDDALVGEEVGERLADRIVLPAHALIVGRNQAGHQADIGLRQFAAGIGQRIQADIERAFAHRRELRVGLDQRRVRIDFGRDLAAAAFGHFGGEYAAQPVAEIALVDRAAGKLMRYFQGGGGLGRAGPEAQDGGRGKRGYKDVATREHG